VTALLEAPAPSIPPQPNPVAARERRLGRGQAIGVVLVVWAVLSALLWGRFSLELDPSDTTAFQDRVGEWLDSVDALRGDSLFFAVIDAIRQLLDNIVMFVQSAISTPTPPSPAPWIGWLGVVAIMTYATFVVGSWKTTLLTAVGFVSLGLLGLWQESMDTLAYTLVAVLLSLLIGIPLGIAAGRSKRLERVLTPVLDFAQIMPTFVYLLPVTLLFLIGPAAAIVVTMIYSIPPAVRITTLAMREVSKTTLEASESLGATGWQTLRKVQLPLANRTIVVGINQTIMAALSMVTIAALISAPGLGQVVYGALRTLDVGEAFRGGIAIVILAIVLDRATTSAANRTRLDTTLARARRLLLVRRVALIVGAVAVVVAVILSRTYLRYAVFPGDGGLGQWVSTTATNVTDWLRENATVLTSGLGEFVAVWIINPLQAVLTQPPWFITCAALIAIAAILGGLRTAITVGVCLALLVGTGLWSASMETLTQVLLATIAVMILGVVVGVAMGRSGRVDALIRPTLDAGQVMPAFVYLVPFLALFGATRLTAIIAAVVYAAPAAIKLVADGIRNIPITIIEAATSIGSNRWQMIRKVQIPCAQRSIAVAANQGVVYVLAMVVVGGLVGGGGLGYLVVAGFGQPSLRGKGFVAGVAIVLLGIVIDRITQAAARDTRAAATDGTT